MKYVVCIGESRIAGVLKCLLQVNDAKSGKRLWNLEPTDTVTAFAVAPQGHIAVTAVGRQDNRDEPLSLDVWDLARGTRLLKLRKVNLGH